MEEARKTFEIARANEEQKVAEAKSALGIFSDYGVQETRNLFWERFAQGKGFATRQSKWDALFLGLRAMGRDENLASYLLRLVIQVLFNFTLGVCGAVIAFLWSLYGLIQTYRASILVALSFFGLAALAAASFALTWLIFLYAATAGTVFVVGKAIAANLRVENGAHGHAQGRRVRFD